MLFVCPQTDKVPPGDGYPHPLKYHRQISFLLTGNKRKRLGKTNKLNKVLQLPLEPRLVIIIILKNGWSLRNK